MQYHARPLQSMTPWPPENYPLVQPHEVGSCHCCQPPARDSPWNIQGCCGCAAYHCLFPNTSKKKLQKNVDHFLKNKNTILPFKKNKTTSFLRGLLQYFSTPILRKPLDWHHGRIPIVVLQGLRSLAAWKREWHLPTSIAKVVKNWWNLKTWHVKFGLYLPARAFFAI